MKREREKMEDKEREAGRGLSAVTIVGIGTKGSPILCHARTRIYIVQYTFIVRGATLDATEMPEASVATSATVTRVPFGGHSEVRSQDGLKRILIHF